MVNKLELGAGGLLTLAGVADALIERDWTTFLQRPFQWVDGKLLQVDLEKEIRSIPIKTPASEFLPHFLLVAGPSLLGNAFSRKSIAIAPLIFASANSLYELVQLLSPREGSGSIFSSPGDAEWKDFFAGVGGAGLAFGLCRLLRGGGRSAPAVNRLRGGWRRINRVPDPDRRVPLEAADIGLLSAQIFSAPTTGYRIFQEVAGRGIALAGALFVYFPLTPLVALAIKLDSSGPVFYRQVRVGLGGAPFVIRKFRTMRAGRITRTGRFLRQHRIDELPQLLHVVSGRMALVGPRPAIPEIFEIYRGISPAAGLRLAAKPGLTGWAQVNNGRYGDQTRTLEYDLYWLIHRDIRFDLEVIWRTIRVVLTGHGGG